MQAHSIYTRISVVLTIGMGLGFGTLIAAQLVDGNGTADHLIQQATAAVAASLAVMLLVLLWMKKNVVAPLTQMTKHVLLVRKLGVLAQSEGSGLTSRSDEIGVLAREYERMLEDVNESQRAVLALSEAELATRSAQLDAALNNMSQGLCMFDEDQRLVVCNDQFASMFGLGPGLITPGTSLAEILRARMENGTAAGPEKTFAEAELSAFAQREQVHTVSALQDGRTIAMQLRPMEAGGWVATYEDITERRISEERIFYLAHHDVLTELPNRARFRLDLEKQLSRAGRGDSTAVLCLDLDHFKAVNDTLGHPIGDALLKAVAERLTSCVRSEDTVARLGGDEFAIIQVGGDQPTGASILARRIAEEISRPFELDGHQVMIGTSIGIAIAPADGLDPDVILKNADLALYRAKADGRATFRFFESAMDAKMQERRQLELDLRRALSQNEFELYYQPLVNLQENRVSAFEALLRWHHPRRGLVPPTDFIPVAEEIGLIVSIGKWVLQKACAEAARWPAGIKVCVNLSPAQFKSPGLVLTVASALADSGLDPSALELEITESVLLQNSEATMSTLHQIRELGVSIAMDDFGTGYSSLSYLRSFPFDKIKIDQSFIQDDQSHQANAIVRAVSGLGVSLGMATTAEGVETAEQLESLRREGCTEVQGYFFSPPRPAAEVTALISRINQMEEPAHDDQMRPRTSPQVA